MALCCRGKNICDCTTAIEVSSPSSSLDHHRESSEIVHKVPVPRSKNTIPAMRGCAGECFFPDDSLHVIKKQKTVSMKLFSVLRYIFPVLQWGSDYNLSLFKSDAVAGLTIASLAIPQGIGYAKLAYLPPNIGLYSSFVPPLIYLVLGSSMDLAVGPSSIMSVVLGSMLREEVSPDDDPKLFQQLAFTATFFAGLLQASFGLLRMGFIVEFLSEPTLVGFMGGAAVITVLQQIKGLLGMQDFTTKTSLVSVMQSVFKHISEVHWETTLMGIGFLLFLSVAKQVSLKKPKFFLIQATAPLVSVVTGTIIVYALRGTNPGIETVGHLQQGLNPPSTSMLIFHGPYLLLAIKTGFVTGILCLAEGIAVGRTFAAMKNYQIDGNKEMVAIGIMNLAGSCSSCFVTTGSLSRSAVNYNAGCKTAISNLVMAFIMLVTMIFLMPVFYYTPNVVLSVTIIMAVIGLIDLRTAIQLWKVDKLDFIACMTAFFGVIFISVPIGLGIAVVISIIKILIPVTRPNIVIMGNVLGTECYRSLEHYKEAVRMPDFLILGIQFPIYFASSVYLQERILRWIREEEERASKIEEEGSIKFVVLDMSAVSAIDSSGIEALLELKQKLNRRSLQLVLANLIGEVVSKLFVSKAWQKFGSDHIYMTVAEAVAKVPGLTKNLNDESEV